VPEPGSVRRAGPLNLLRARAGAERVTNVELFFDLVYVFAVTQLSHFLLGQPTAGGAPRAGLLPMPADRHPI
jgi:low temperature requirement protein LtrA